MEDVIDRSNVWLAFDSGLTSASRGHLEETILNHAERIGCHLDWLITHQLNTGARRVAFTMSSADAVTLIKLVDDLKAHFPSYAVEQELTQLISDSKSKSSGRAVVFPIDVDVSSSISQSELISHSAIDAIYAVGEVLPIDAIIQVNGFIRPTFKNGVLELLVERVAGGFFAPIERRAPHECCGGHPEEEPIFL